MIACPWGEDVSKRDRLRRDVDEMRGVHTVVDQACSGEPGDGSPCC